jgi:uncharacterized alkaline shock family protein YloU
MLTQETELGTITITQRAILRVAARAVQDCYGVVGFAQLGLRDDLAERLHLHGTQRGVIVRRDGPGLAIDLYVVLAHGVRISEVAQNIAESVRFAVERATGVSVIDVNVHVQEVKEALDADRRSA